MRIADYIASRRQPTRCASMSFPPPPATLSTRTHAPPRTRKLLVRREELDKLTAKTQQKGLTLIPLRIYFKGGKAKCELAVARGKQLWDKRETERRKTADAEARAAIARGRRR